MAGCSPEVRWFLSFVGLVIAAVSITRAADPQPAGAIRLLVRADDMGAAHSVNVACIESYTHGIARSVEVIVPGPWFPEAVKLIEQTLGADVGVHLCLTSEWENVKWKPMTYAPSLTDADGYFHPMTSQRADFPPGTGFITSNPKIDEVEKELRAQIETALRHLPGRISHVSTHMGAATATPALRVLTEKLAAEYKLRLESTNLKHAPGFGDAKTSPEQKETLLAKLLEDLQPGQYLMVQHPGEDSPEMRAIFHKGYETVATDRLGVTRAFTSDRVKAVIQQKHIQLISYADLPLAGSPQAAR